MIEDILIRYAAEQNNTAVELNIRTRIRELVASSNTAHEMGQDSSAYDNEILQLVQQAKQSGIDVLNELPTDFRRLASAVQTGMVIMATNMDAIADDLEKIIGFMKKESELHPHVGSQLAENIRDLEERLAKMRSPYIEVARTAKL